MSKKRRAKIPPFRVLNSENIFRKFVSKIMRSCDKNFAQLHLRNGVVQISMYKEGKETRLLVNEQVEIVQKRVTNIVQKTKKTEE